MAWASTIPTVLAALTTALEDLDNVTVSNGVPVQAPTGDGLIIGYSGPDDPTAVTGTMVREAFVALPSHERYTVSCRIEATAADTDMPTAQARTLELFASVGGVLAADPRLGGLVNWAQPEAFTLFQAQSPRGAFAVLQFGIDVDAHTTT